MERSYGVSSQRILADENDRYVEEIQIKGFTLIKDLIPGPELEKFRKQIDLLNEKQKREEGEDLLDKIKENNMVRLPLSQESMFLSLISNQKVQEIVKTLIGNFIILHLQNAIINNPAQEHHQSSWHRDLPYQDFVISKPISISILYCIDDFNEKTGGTRVLPFSHKIDHLPSGEYLKNNELQIEAKAGDALIFDSMLYHRAGYNNSGKIRRGVNNVYTIPLIKQQINIPAALNGKYKDNEEVSAILGYTSITPESADEFRKIRENKMKLA